MREGAQLRRVARRELRGDPANVQTRRRASGTDPRKRAPREPIGQPDSALRPSYRGLRIPCPICTGAVWSHQVHDQKLGYKTRGAPGQYLDRDRDLTPKTVVRYPKNPYTGAHGAYFEYLTADREALESAAFWMARQMDAWLGEHGPEGMAQQALVDAERTIRQLTDERRELFRRAGEADALWEDRERLRAEVASLSREVETLLHRRDLGLAAVPDVTVSLEPRSQPEPLPPRRWEACRDARICTVRHFEALENAARCRSDWEQRISYLGEAGPKGWFTHDAKVLVDYARRDYAAALKRYAEMTAEPCQRPCCANREWLLADLEAVS